MSSRCVTSKKKTVVFLYFFFGYGAENIVVVVKLSLAHNIFSTNQRQGIRREGVRGVAGVAMATPKIQDLFHKMVLKKSQKNSYLL